MKFLYGIYGANIPVIKEFTISETEKISAGEIVRCSNSGDVGKNTIGYCIGVAAEDHSGKEDILNARSCGNKLMVDITGGGVYSVPAPRIKVTEGTSGTAVFKCGEGVLTQGVVGIKLVLFSKGDGSQNTDSVGTAYTVSSIAISSGVATVTLDRETNISEGDILIAVPYTGFKGNVDEDCKSFTFKTVTGVTLETVGFDEKNGCLEVLIDGKLF